MFTVAYQTYPMGYQSPLSSGSKTATEPDAQIVRLYNDYCKGNSLLSSMAFRKEVIVAVKRLFGYFPEWLDAQDKNTRISESAYQLLKDMLDFMNTGRRDVELAVRLSIIGTEQQTNTYLNPEASARTSRLRDAIKFNPVDFVFVWMNCSDDGFYDMLCTTHAIFGLVPRGQSH